MVFFVSSEVQTTSLLLHSNAVNLSITLCRSCKVPGLSWPIASYNPPDSNGITMALLWVCQWHHLNTSRTWPSCRALQQVTSERRATAEDRHENHPQRVAWRISRRSSRRKERQTLSTLGRKQKSFKRIQMIQTFQLRQFRIFEYCTNLPAFLALYVPKFQRAQKWG